MPSETTKNKYISTVHITKIINSPKIQYTGMEQNKDNKKLKLLYWKLPFLLTVTVNSQILVYIKNFVMSQYKTLPE